MEKYTVIQKGTLYTYINGEAELYLPYGSPCLLQPSTKNRKTWYCPGSGIFQMGSTLDAFGIFSYYRNPESNASASAPEDLSMNRNSCFIKTAIL